SSSGTLAYKTLYLAPPTGKKSNTSDKKAMDVRTMMPPPSQLYLCKMCYSEITNIHSARNHLLTDHSLYLSTNDTWDY
ncbi:hypothetical protein EV175_006580, partial [Coemansia sp. RSA 1933]